MRMRHLLSACVAAALLCAAPAGRAQDPSELELELELERESRAAPSDVLALTGFALLGLAYGDSVGVAIFSGRPADKRLFIPVAGPWLDLAERDCSGCSAEWLARSLLVLDGVTQGLGVGLLVASLFVPDPPRHRDVGHGRVRIAPLVGRGTVGITGAASF